MRRRHLLLATALLLPGLPAFGQHFTQQLAATGAGATLFVNRATNSDNFEIESSRILLAGSSHPQIRAFAQQMIEAHTATSAELRAMPEASTRLPSGLDDRLQAKLIALRGYQGNELDRWYVQMQVEAHEEALELFEMYAFAGEVSSLKEFATRHAPALRRHLELARSLQQPAPRE